MSLDRELEDVREFHQRFDQLDPTAISHLTRRKLAERANFMLEELREFAESAGLTFQGGKFTFLASDADDQSMAGMADALIDLVYVAKGTAAMMGLGAAWVELWDDVQRANMAKVKGPTHRAMGYGADIAKPEGWRPPQTDAILIRNGYRRESFSAIVDRLCLDDAEAPR